MSEQPTGPFCQSCAMPMQQPADFGTNLDGTGNDEYCCYCFRSGKFTAPDMTLEQMIEKLVGFAGKMNMSEAQASEMASTWLPQLKRWRSR